MIPAIEANWSSNSFAPRCATLRIESGWPAAIQIGGCGFCFVGGSTTMFSKFQNLPWCEKRSSLVHAFRITDSNSSKRSSASAIGMQKPENSLCR